MSKRNRDRSKPISEGNQTSEVTEAPVQTAPEEGQQTMTDTNTAETQAAPATPAAPAAVKDGSKVILTNGEPRVDFIRRLWAEGKTRSEITKAVNELSGGIKVPYQVIFGVTKKEKDKAAAAAAKAAGGGDAPAPAPAS